MRLVSVGYGCQSLLIILYATISIRFGVASFISLLRRRLGFRTPKIFRVFNIFYSYRSATWYPGNLFNHCVRKASRSRTIPGEDAASHISGLGSRVYPIHVIHRWTHCVFCQSPSDNLHYWLHQDCLFVLDLNSSLHQASVSLHKHRSVSASPKDHPNLLAMGFSELLHWLCYSPVHLQPNRSYHLSTSKAAHAVEFELGI